ncbi:hypothetical protein FRB99_002348, partial [Tulasnella sp. 403]
MYEDHCGDESDLFAGLMRGPMQVRAFIRVFFGESALNRHLKGKPVTSSDKKRANNAKLGKLSSVTAGGIAYVTIILRHALSEEKSFGEGEQDVFDNSAFYYEVLDLLEGPGEKAAAQREKAAVKEERAASEDEKAAFGEALADLAQPATLADTTNGSKNGTKK